MRITYLGRAGFRVPASGQEAAAFARRVEAGTDACCDPVAPGEGFAL